MHHQFITESRILIYFNENPSFPFLKNDQVEFPAEANVYSKSKNVFNQKKILKEEEERNPLKTSSNFEF